jgi:hypothetical protein
MRMIGREENRYGMSPRQAIAICIACATLILTLFAILPEG